MKNSLTSTLSKKKYTFQILDALEADIEISENPYQLPIEELFTMAARINKKRSFLFVSKVLGKHWPIEPNKGLLTAALLAARFLEVIKGVNCPEKEQLVQIFHKEGTFKRTRFIPAGINPIVIGFAETATALGQAFFDCFQTADYFHTTREAVLGCDPEITFEEEHSHATSHRLFIPPDIIRTGREVILVDDEMTSGKTALNMIRSIQTRFPRTHYTVISILDWRSEENLLAFSQLEQELGIIINVVSLLAGKVRVRKLKEISDGEPVYENKIKTKPLIEKIHLAPFFTSSSLVSINQANKCTFIKETGRFGLNSAENDDLQQKIAHVAAILKEKQHSVKTLCLGTGEFMYLPMRIAAEMGSGISYHSTTRSPIYINNQNGYGARYGLSFCNPEDTSVSHFVYNIPPRYYDEIFLFFEREAELVNYHSLFTELEKLQLQSVKLVFFSR
jgi:hypothetical protein